MNCNRAKRLIDAWIDGDLPESRRAELEAHLAECASCEREATALSRSLALLRRAPVEEPAENFNWRVRLAIHRERQRLVEEAASTRSTLRAWNARFALSAAAGFAAILVGGWFGMQSYFAGAPGATPTDVASSAAGTSRVEVERPATSASSASLAERALRSARVGRRTTPSPFGADPLATGAGRLVSGGVLDLTRGPRGGAIDMVDDPSALDSLVRRELAGLSNEARVRYLRCRIELLQHYLEQTGGAIATPADDRH